MLIYAAFKSHAKWSNTQHVNIAYTPMQPTTVGIDYSLNYFSHKLYAWQNIAKFLIHPHTINSFTAFHKRHFGGALTNQKLTGMHMLNAVGFILKKISVSFIIHYSFHLDTFWNTTHTVLWKTLRRKSKKIKWNKIKMRLNYNVISLVWKYRFLI